MFSRSLAYALAPVLIAAGVVLSTARWYLEPGRRTSAVFVLLVLVLMTAAFAFATRRARRNESKRADADAIASAVIFAALTVVLALGGSLATTLGDLDFGRRATMVVFGAFLAFTGNAMPKQLQPLSALACDPARVQAFQRFSGWTWTLTGLAMATLWIALPVETASPLTVVLLFSAMLMIARRLLNLRDASTPA